MRGAILILALATAPLGACDRAEHLDAPPGESAPAAGLAAAEMDLGGAPVDPNATVLATAARAANLTTFVSALQAAGLDRSLSREGPVTIFAPGNDAWAAIDPAEREALVRPEGHDALARLLNGHMVDGRITGADLAERTRAGGGTTVLTTRSGTRLTIRTSGGQWNLTDEGGHAANVTQAGAEVADGVIYVIDAVHIPSE